MVGGAWPFLVGGVDCLVDSDNERDYRLLNRFVGATSHTANCFLEGSMFFKHMIESNNRSVMPLDVRGRTRATLTVPKSMFLTRQSWVTF